MEQRTKITRSWGATIGYLIGAIVALGVSVLLFMTIAEGAVTIGIALIPAVVAVILVFMSFSGAGSAACPACGAQLSGLSTKSNDGVLCLNCRTYAEGSDGMLWRTDENRIADEPIFSSPLPEQFNFPDGCCVCGRAEVGREKISLQHQQASSAVTAQAGLTSYTRVSVEVPHCAEHAGRARLTGTPNNTHIRL